MAWLDDPVAAALALPVFALPLFLFVSAALEYVVPPFMGDTFVLLGFFLSGQGAVAPAVAFGSAFAGSVIGSVLAYQLGQRYGLALIRRLSPQRAEEISRRRVGDLFRRFGHRLLLVNRFLPVIRGFLLYGAGATKLPFRPVILYSSVSNLLFLGLLMGLGLWTAGTWSEIEAGFRQSNRWIGGVVLASVAIWVAWTIWRLRRSAAGRS